MLVTVLSDKLEVRFRKANRLQQQQAPEASVAAETVWVIPKNQVRVDKV